MAAATRSRRTTKAKPAPEPEVLEDDLETVEDPTDEVEELEELDEAEVSENKPAPKKASKKTEDITFGIQDLVKHIKDETGKDTDPRSIRTLIRKMAREDNPRVAREIKAGNRTRYNWSGPNHPEVRAIVEAFKAGELDQDKKEKLAALKERKSVQKAAAKKDDAVDEVEEVEGDEDLDFEEDE